MIKVITYGTYDLLHFGHIRLLERAKELGDYLIVGITSDDFDRERGKINVQQSLIERIAAVEATGIVDEIIVEEYAGQKIDDIKRYDIDIFTVGSDWVGKFDYLNEYCRVVYLDRTKGLSSSEIRADRSKINIGLVGGDESSILIKYYNECQYVNGLEVKALCTQNDELKQKMKDKVEYITEDYSDFLTKCDAVYIVSHPSVHYDQVEEALLQEKHVLCESPISLSEKETKKLFKVAKEKNVTLMESIKTAYSMAYSRLVLLTKSGKIGDIMSVDATCTSLIDMNDIDDNKTWNSICAWGPTAMLPIFHVLGTEYRKKHINSYFLDEKIKYDIFTKVDFVFDNAVASLKVGRGVKSEGELVISGTKGYVYVPAPWWKTDYFEIRYENPQDNKKCFYRLDGEGIRYELVAFVRSINSGKPDFYISNKISSKISGVIESFYNMK
ncbi:MAG: glycerol-3-phosphate cytidylyltransferase [Clostridiales bacterium]|nr:MAG: glycerol-3-phosphate cytidylyltransferase [Clostridiales bacterium]